ncbi:MAG: hypothetical protein CMJ81_22770 [Planctomycetaceae bacterium]|nr:hypothetical protein [Planctomycetaceae bacterium]MBP61749.1 hypothetical protein [Planctomycetaceae bacterium]
MMETGLLFLAAFFLYFVPGYLVLGMFRKLNSWERVGASFAVSMTLFALIEFFVYLSGGPQRSLNIACLALVIFLAGLGWWLRGAPGLDRPGIWLLISYFGFTIQIVLLDAVLPIYPDMWTFDWIEHYFRSIFYLNHLPTDNSYWIFSVPTRLPGYNLNGAFFLSLFGAEQPGVGHGPLGVNPTSEILTDTRVGSGFYLFQICNAIQSGAFFLGVILLARRLLGGRAAVLAGLLLFFNAGLLHNARFTWPKLSSAYLSLLGIYFYFSARDAYGNTNGKTGTLLGLLAGCFAGSGYMAHQIGGPALGGVFLHGCASQWWQDRRRLIGAYVLGALLIITPWYAWSISTYGAQATTGGPSQVLKQNTSPELRSVEAKLATIKASFWPHSTSTLNRWRGSDGSVPWKVKFAEWHMNGITGALTIPLTLFLVIAGIGWSGSWYGRRTGAGTWKILPQDWTSDGTCLALVGGLHVVAAFTLHAVYYSSGIVHSTMTQAVLLLFLLAVGIFARATRLVALLVFLLIVLDSMTHWWWHVIPDMDSLLWTTSDNMQHKVSHQIRALWDEHQARGSVTLMKAILLLIQGAAAVGGCMYLLSRPPESGATPGPPENPSEARA